MSAPSVPLIEDRPWPSSGSIRFFWMPPASDGGSPILYYTLECASISYSEQITAPATTRTVTGLTNGVEHVFTLTATNANGTGPAATFLSVQPGILPFGPTVASLSSLNVSTALVTWNLSTIANEGVPKWFVITVIPSTPSLSSYEKSSYIFERARTFQVPSTNIAYQFLVQAINDTGYCRPFAYTSTLQFLLNAPLAPTNLQGLQIWIDAADAATVSTSVNLSTVVGVTDKSANAYRFTGGTGYTYNVTKFNGTYPSFFNSSGQIASLIGSNGSIFIPQPITAFYVGIRTSGDYLHHPATTTAPVLAALGAGPGGNLLDIRAGTPFTTTYQISTNFIASAVFNSVSSLAYTNGQTASYGSIGTNPMSTLMLGGTPYNNYAFCGHMCEYLFYSGALTPFNRQKIEGYLGWKWGLQNNLPVSHPFRAAAPTVVSVFSPSNLPGMALWLDATQLTGLSNGQAITTWTDRSPNPASNAASNGPRYITSSINNLPTIRFNGSNQYVVFNTSTVNIRTSSFYAFVVAKYSTINTVGLLMAKGIAPGSNRQYFGKLNSTGSNDFNLEVNVGGGAASLVPFNSASPTMFGYYWDRTTMFNVLNASTAGTASFVSAADYGNTYNFLIGAYNNNVGGVPPSGTYFPGDIGEILIYLSPLATEDRQTVEGYMAWKWGLQGSLPITHPYKYQSPQTTVSTNDTIYDGAVVNFRASDYISSSTWSNTTGGFGFSHNAVLTAGAISKNAQNNGIFFSTARMQISSFPSLSSFTVTSWFRRTGIFGGAGVGGAGGIISDTAGNGQINMLTSNNGVALAGTLFINSVWYQGSTISFPPNTWRQMTFSWNNATKQLKSYINSTLIHTSTFSSAPTPSSSGGVYYIGTDWAGTQSISAGDIGQVLVYNRALSDSEVVYNYNVTSSLFPPVPTPSTQLILQYNAATYSGSGPWTNTGTLGTAYNATINTGTPSTIGTGNGIVFNNGLIYQVPNFGPLFTYTQMFWFKRIGPTATLFSQRWTGGAQVYFTGMAEGDQVSSMFARIYYNSSSFVTSSVSIVPDTWQNLAHVWNGSSFVTYLNGIQTVSNAFQNITSEQDGDIYYIGASWGGAVRLRAHLGEVRLYNGPLTSSQIFSTFQATSTSYSNVPISTQMLLYYDATSYTGSGSWSNLGTMGSAYNASTFAGTPAKNAEGNGINFNGSLIFSVPNFGTIYNYTQSIWFKRNAITRALMSQRFTGGPVFFTSIARGDAGRGVYGGIYYNGNLFAASTLTTDTETWYNLTNVWNGSSMISYLNGVQRASNAQPIYSEEDGDIYFIGSIWNESDKFIGDIGEVRMYNGPLTSSQVLTLYTSTSSLYPYVAPSTQMLLYYSATNYTGSGAWSNLGSLGTSRNANITTGTPSKNAAGNGVVFNGSLHYAISSLNVSLPDFTFATWFKRTTASMGVNGASIFSQAYTSGSYINLVTRQTNPSTMITSIFSGAWYDTAPITLGSNIWVHIAATYDGSTMRTYSNGVLTSTSVYNNVFAENDGLIWRIGTSWDLNGNITGQIGEIRLYRGALTPSTISTLYGSTLTATFSV